MKSPGTIETGQLTAGRQPTGRLPRQFWGLAATEVWERFSFYGLQAVLSFYLFYSITDGGLGLPTNSAVGIVGAYGAFVYIMQFVGGWLGDRLIPPRVLVAAGGVVIMVGHIALAVVPGLSGLAVGLVCIAVGTGALKTNISVIVGRLLPADAAYRDAGFSYFLMAINTGALLGPLAAGWMQSVRGFHAAFVIAAIGMALGLVQYIVGYSRLPAESAIVADPVRGRALLVPAMVGAVAAVLIVAVVASGVVPPQALTYLAGGLIVVCAAALFGVVLRAPTTTAVERRRVLGFLPLWVAAVLYYGILLQIFTTMAIFIADRVDLRVLGWDMPGAWLITSFSVFGVSLTPVIARLWARGWFARFGAATKVTVGLVLVSWSYLILLLSEFSPGKTVSPILVMATMAIAGVSEVFVNPVTLSLVTRIAPENFRSQLTALGVIVIGGGAALSGILGILFTVIPTLTYLTLVGVGGLLIAATLRAAAPWIHRMVSE
ncbi:peptide MFS transporter [Nocardia sp. NPDC058379]|uniref:peptide MFS transporter n=1 Tax=unclassified Nocardia TaxID=2637762 RepID=UPI00365560B0